MRTRIGITLVWVVGSLATAPANEELEARIAALEKEVAELRTSLAPVIEQAKGKQVVDDQRARARVRMRKDLEVYSREELREIESLYQVANQQWNSPEGKESLGKLIERYDKANRTGCALLYLGQMSKGAEKVDYLTRAIEGFSDCYYGDGVQVGAYARFHLAYHHKEAGEEEKAAAIFDEIRECYPDAIDHKGRPLSGQLER